MVGTPDWNLLPLFVAVAEAGTISDAARKLGAPKSSVSRGISALEAELRTQLLHRSTRGIQLTTAGRVFYERVRPMVASYRELAGALPAEEAEPSGLLRVTAPGDMAVTFFVDVLAGFLERYPAVRLDFRPSYRVVDLVGEGYDVALRLAARLESSALRAKRLGTIDLALFASPQYVARFGAPRALSDCAKHRLIVFSSLTRLPKELRASAATRVSTDDLLVAHSMARAGVGLTVLPAHLTRDDVLAGRLVRVAQRWKQTFGSLYFVYPPVRPTPRAVAALRDYLADAFAQHPLTLAEG